MNKNNIIFSCSNCNAQFQKWIGRCLECGKWGTIEKAQANTQKNLNIENEYDAIKTTTLDEIQGKNFKRLKTGVEELDRVLGGGLVPGSLILLGGEPGVGKSTLALQLAALLPNALYLSGEESIEQIKLRAERLALKSPTLQLANTTNIENIIATIQKNPSLAIIDSVQTVSSSEAEGEAGNITQIRACTTKLMALAKTTGAVIVLIGQVTKDGAVAGPKTLEHLVDVVLYLEGDKYHQYRILRAAKNRFGSTDEIGVFNMMEGSRPVLVEIQALVTKTNFGYPQRRASGFDLNRLQVLIGVLGKRAGLPLDSYDVFLNVVGGIVAEEPAADLAVILALASALQNKTLPKNIAAFGEVGLGGEVRAVGQIRKRLEEIKKMGFEFAVTPSLKETDKITGLKIAPIKNVKEVVEKIIK